VHKIYANLRRSQDCVEEYTRYGLYDAYTGLGTCELQAKLHAGKGQVHEQQTNGRLDAGDEVYTHR
jgi:hypothetical protein